MNTRKPQPTKPITASTRATKASGIRRLNTVTATPQALSMNAHSNNEPSCPPHTAAKR